MLPAYAIVDIIVAQLGQISCHGIFQIDSARVLLQQESQDREDLGDTCDPKYRFPSDIGRLPIDVISKDWCCMVILP